MASFWLNAGAIAACLIPYDKLANPGPKESTQVQVGIGAGTNGDDVNSGGSVPHLALWDQDGNRIGQYHGDANGHYDPGTANEVSVDNSQNGEAKASPHYLSVVAMENDAVCISMVSVSGNGVNWGWTGDLAKMCGDSDWYPSSYIVGDGTSTPSCIWIDHDHTNGINAAGFSLHMPDFANSDGRQNQLTNDIDTNCKSAPRMTFWYDMLPDDIPPFFSPPLEYNDDGSDKDPDAVKTRDSNLFPSDPKVKRHARDLRKRDSNLKPEHLVISALPAHSAKEVCEDHNSLGWDFVSTAEGTYCDISARQWYPLCSASVTKDCFDLDQKQLRTGSTNDKRDVAAKSYQTSETWPKPGQ